MEVASNKGDLLIHSHLFKIIDFPSICHLKSHLHFANLLRRDKERLEDWEVLFSGQSALQINNRSENLLCILLTSYWVSRPLVSEARRALGNCDRILHHLTKYRLTPWRGSRRLVGLTAGRKLRMRFKLLSHC